MALVILADVKVYLNIAIAETKHDELLGLLIDQCSALIETFCNRTFIQSSYAEKYDGDNSASLFVDNYPLVSVTSLTVDGIACTSSDYVFYRDGEVKLVDGSIFTKDNQNVEIAYTAGFSPIPKDVQLVCFKLVALKFKEYDSDRIGMASLSGGDQNVGFVISEFPDDIKDILKAYRKIPKCS